MEERINKPRVFLSHSKKNVDFIENLAHDLRKCQIEPWLDTDQIRHGRSWQDSIFEYGLPTCDAVIVYFTETSIQSAVVKKEMDVGLLQNIKDSNIAFLPYVSDEKLRAELRPDIQALQVPEWNEKNYYPLLPRVVAEIWRSYLERTINLAIKDERLKRVQLELELEKLKNQPDDVFSNPENKEFEFISNSFNKIVPFRFILRGVEDGQQKVKYTRNGVVYLSTCVALLSDFFDPAYGSGGLNSTLAQVVMDLIDVEVNVPYPTVTDIPDFMDELLTHGLVDKITYTTVDEYRSEYVRRFYELSKKYFRYRYWLAYHQNLPFQIKVELDKTS